MPASVVQSSFATTSAAPQVRFSRLKKRSTSFLATSSPCSSRLAAALEEAGIRVKNITYYKSQPWGIAQDILMGFFCEVDGDDTIRMDGNELKYAQWVERKDIVLQPTDYSLTNEMMRMFKEGKI